MVALTVSLIAPAASALPSVEDVPSSPRNLRASFVNKDIVLSWQAPAYVPDAGLSGYRVYRLGATGWSLIGTPEDSSFTDSGATSGPDRQHTYRITALGSSGEGDGSIIVIMMGEGETCRWVIVGVTEGGEPYWEIDGICVINDTTGPLPEPLRSMVRQILIDAWQLLSGDP